MLKVYAVRDVKADSFSEGLITTGTDGLALRIFADACQDGRTNLAKYPSDFMLYRLGEYDPSSGLLTALAVPELVGTASQFVKRDAVPEVVA